MSALVSYILPSVMTSGAIHSGVPMNVDRLLFVCRCAATPKSASTILPTCVSSTLAAEGASQRDCSSREGGWGGPLTSRWMMPCRCRNDSATSTSRRMSTMYFSAIGPDFICGVHATGQRCERTVREPWQRTRVRMLPPLAKSIAIQSSLPLR
mgnify:CR=1 FL=1